MKEQEIKLSVLQDETLDISRVALIVDHSVNDGETLSLSNTYFDTPDKRCQQAKVGLRLRRINQQWLQTVKTSGQAHAGLHQREEWEHAIPGPAFERALLMQTALATLIEDDGVWEALAPVFTTEFTRWVQVLDYQGTQIELAYDVGYAEANDHRAPIHEIELELKHGEVKALTAFAEALMATLPLAYNDISKAQLGYQLAHA
jgi:inorganic triphosphatase YgiF